MRSTPADLKKVGLVGGHGMAVDGLFAVEETEGLRVFGIREQRIFHRGIGGNPAFQGGGINLHHSGRGGKL
jgi:hypothetical protein